jgi:outer membrane lipoprotein-sorting protein
MRIRKAFAAGLLALTPALTGCLTRTHTVLKTHPPDVVLNATLDDLLQQVDTRYKAINTATLTVAVTATTGGSLQGKVTQYTSFSAYIVLSQPENIRFIGLLPIARSTMIDMVSDGKTFKVVIPHPGCAIVGSDVSEPSQKGLYSLRPEVILDSLLIPGMRNAQVVSMTQDSRVVPNPEKRKDYIQEPDYDIEFLSQPQGLVASTLRVLHISRVNLLPYRQDAYNAEGKVATQAVYSNYQRFGDIQFPTKVVIERPLDELSLALTVTKASFNQKLQPDQFKLEIPERLPVQNMDDPVSAKSNPCVSHAPPPQH